MSAFSAACERNKAPILDVLCHELSDRFRVLEVGSGTGQHAVFFARHLIHLTWQPTDQSHVLSGLAARIADEGSDNLMAPVMLDVLDADWAKGIEVSTIDAVFTANTLHIMSWPAVEAFFKCSGVLLQTGGTLCVYGPFRYADSPFAPSNAAFDEALRASASGMGIRDFAAVDALACQQGLELSADYEMPANNRLLVWRTAH